MLKSAKFSNFTIVPDALWKFSSGLNVIIGENGTGKSHVLKSLYSVLRSLKASSNRPTEAISKTALEKEVAEQLIANMRPETLGRLVKRRPGRNRCEIKLTFHDKRLNTGFSFATNAKTQVDIDPMPSISLDRDPVFIPTRELVTLSPWFISLYDNFHVEFERSWRDTVSLLGAPLSKGPKQEKIRSLLEPLEQAMGGKVEVDQNGRFYLRVNNGRMEAPLVAEGLRKFAMLARLIATGTLFEKGYLFWDEPEANLNPKLIKVAAQVITSLASQGIQIFVATHSLFLLREIEMLTDLTKPDVPSRYFAIAAPNGSATATLEQGETVDDLSTLVILDEELEQSDRFLKTGK